MHVVIVQSSANSTTFGWEQGLEELGHRVTLLTGSAKRQFGGRPGAAVHALPNMAWTERLARRSPAFRRHVDAFPLPRRARAELRALRPDLALVKADQARNLVIVAALRRLGIPWLVWQEQLPPLSQRWRVAGALGLRPVAAFTALDARPGGVVLPSSDHRLPRISYVPVRIPADGAVGPERDGPTGGPVRVLVVASFKNHRVKRSWWVLDAAAEGALLDGSVTFTFVGQGGPEHEGYRRVARRAAELGVERLVELRPNVPFEDMAALYAAHDVLVLPSLREQFGMCIPEAMTHGLPTIVSDIVGAIGCVDPEGTGLVFPVDDLSALSAALVRIVRDDALRARLGARARGFVADHLDVRATAAEILRLVSPEAAGVAADPAGDTSS